MNWFPLLVVLKVLTAQKIYKCPSWVWAGERWKRLTLPWIPRKGLSIVESLLEFMIRCHCKHSDSHFPINKQRPKGIGQCDSLIGCYLILLLCFSLPYGKWPSLKQPDQSPVNINRLESLAPWGNFTVAADCPSSSGWGLSEECLKQFISDFSLP